MLVIRANVPTCVAGTWDDSASSADKTRLRIMTCGFASAINQDGKGACVTLEGPRCLSAHLFREWARYATIHVPNPVEWASGRVPPPTFPDWAQMWKPLTMSAWLRAARDLGVRYRFVYADYTCTWLGGSTGSAYGLCPRDDLAYMLSEGLVERRPAGSPATICLTVSTRFSGCGSARVYADIERFAIAAGFRPERLHSELYNRTMYYVAVNLHA